MKPQDLARALVDLPPLHVTAATTTAEAAAALHVLASFNGCMIGLIRFSGRTPWERHPDDELLHVLEGTVDVTVLLDDGAGNDAAKGLDLRRTEGKLAPTDAEAGSVPAVHDARGGHRRLVGGRSPSPATRDAVIESGVGARRPLEKRRHPRVCEVPCRRLPIMGARHSSDAHDGKLRHWSDALL